jgi:hypothetical protein
MPACEKSLMPQSELDVSAKHLEQHLPHTKFSINTLRKYQPSPARISREAPDRPGWAMPQQKAAEPQVSWLKPQTPAALLQWPSPDRRWGRGTQWEDKVTEDSWLLSHLGTTSWTQRGRTGCMTLGSPFSVRLLPHPSLPPLFPQSKGHLSLHLQASWFNTGQSDSGYLNPLFPIKIIIIIKRIQPTLAQASQNPGPWPAAWRCGQCFPPHSMVLHVSGLCHLAKIPEATLHRPHQ